MTDRALILSNDARMHSRTSSCVDEDDSRASMLAFAELQFNLSLDAALELFPMLL